MLVGVVIVGRGVVVWAGEKEELLLIVVDCYSLLSSLPLHWPAPFGEREEKVINSMRTQ